MSDPKKILIVEDDSRLARALQLKLHHAGYHATISLNGQQALEYLAQESFDLILLDLVMPGKDGFDVLKEIKTRAITIPIIVNSNLGQQEERQKAMNLGAVQFFVKAETQLDEILHYIDTLFRT